LPAIPGEDEWITARRHESDPINWRMKKSASSLMRLLAFYWRKINYNFKSTQSFQVLI